MLVRTPVMLALVASFPSCLAARHDFEPPCPPMHLVICFLVFRGIVPAEVYHGRAFRAAIALWLLFLCSSSGPRCDDSPSDSASWKGLSTAKGFCQVLEIYFRWRCHCCISSYIDHDPGFRNATADGLSRDRDPVSLGLSPSDEITIPFKLFPCPPRPSYHPSEARPSILFLALDSLILAGCSPSTRLLHRIRLCCLS